MDHSDRSWDFVACALLIEVSDRYLFAGALPTEVVVIVDKANSKCNDG